MKDNYERMKYGMKRIICLFTVFVLSFCLFAACAPEIPSGSSDVPSSDVPSSDASSADSITDSSEINSSFSPTDSSSDSSTPKTEEDLYMLLDGIPEDISSIIKEEIEQGYIQSAPDASVKVITYMLKNNRFDILAALSKPNEQCPFDFNNAVGVNIIDASYTLVSENNDSLFQYNIKYTVGDSSVEGISTGEHTVFAETEKMWVLTDDGEYATYYLPGDQIFTEGLSSADWDKFLYIYFGGFSDFLTLEDLETEEPQRFADLISTAAEYLVQRSNDDDDLTVEDLNAVIKRFYGVDDYYVESERGKAIDRKGTAVELYNVFGLGERTMLLRKMGIVDTASDENSAYIKVAKFDSAFAIHIVETKTIRLEKDGENYIVFAVE